MDYPAAHSMDTSWYAIDDDGHIAAFWSCEGGAVPETAAQELPDVTEASVKDLGEVHAVKTVAPAHVKWVVNTFKGKHCQEGRYTPGGLHILSNVPLGLDELIRKMSSEVDRTAPFVRAIEIGDDYHPFGGGASELLHLLIAPERTHAEKLATVLHEEGACLTCTDHWNMYGFWISNGAGLIYYRHPYANAAAFPYMRQFIPQDLKKVDELGFGDILLQDLQRTKMEGCFLDRPFWQPASELPCALYGDDESRVVHVDSEKFKELMKGPYRAYW